MIRYFCQALWLLFVVFSCAQAQSYWLNSDYNDQGEHYLTAEEAGELQRRLDIH